MNTFHIQVAGVVICFCAEYHPAESLLTDFRCNGPADFRIALTDEDMSHKLTPNNGKKLVKSTEVLRKVADAIIECDVILFHGATVAVGNSAYLFTAPSRTGKTTHIRHWLSNLPEAYVINGDKPFIKFQGDNSLPPLVCGSPWAGKENLYTNTMVPLKAIICMERAEDNSIHEITFADAFPFLLQQTYRPKDEDKMRKTLRLLQRLKSKVKFYHFYCNNFKDDCFETVYKALEEKNGDNADHKIASASKRII